LILCVDTLRADHLGHYGYARATSPRLDRLAAEGVVFDRAQAQSNWTVPATATILTSLLPSGHGAGLSGDLRLLSESSPPAQMHPAVRPLATVLAEAGFRTALYSANPFLYGRFKDGFEEAFVDWVPAATLSDQAAEWASQQGDDRFFMYVQYMDLHQPVEPPEPFFHAFQPYPAALAPRELVNWSFGQQASLDAPDFLRYRRHRIGLYDGAIRYVDTQIGRLVDHLERAGLLDHTLIVVTSDHGEEFWDHAEDERALGGDPRGLWGIGHGHSMYQELLWVPLVFRGPGVAGGRRVGCDARHLDVAPTALALLGLAPEPEMRGESLARHLGASDEAEGCRPLPMISESPAYGPDARALVWRGYKLVTRADGVTLLFDLERDPRELSDLSAARPAVVSELRRILVGQKHGTHAERSVDPWSEEASKDLRALGYLGGTP
jgi:arylsulfatase A-like enzyme